MPLNINTTGAVYQQLLSSLQTVNTQLKTKYGPALIEMSKDNRRAFVQSDPILQELKVLYVLLQKLEDRLQ